MKKISELPSLLRKLERSGASRKWNFSVHHTGITARGPAHALTLYVPENLFRDNYGQRVSLFNHSSDMLDLGTRFIHGMPRAVNASYLYLISSVHDCV